MMRVHVELCVDFRPPIQLSEVEDHKIELLHSGVYFLSEGLLKATESNLNAAEIVYIGKAIRETIFSRCRKHMWSVQNTPLSNGKPKTAPGRWFKRFREKIKLNAEALWITPGIMDVGKPYAISCAEEYLLHEYKLKHGRYPECNSSGQQRDA